MKNKRGGKCIAKSIDKKGLQNGLICKIVLLRSLTVEANQEVGHLEGGVVSKKKKEQRGICIGGDN